MSYFVTYNTSTQNLHYHLRLLPSLVALLPIFILICSFIPFTFVSLSDIIRTVNNSTGNKSIVLRQITTWSSGSCYCYTSHFFCSLAVLLLNLTSLICSGTSSSSSNNNIHLVVHSGRPMQIAVRQQLSATQSRSDVLGLPVSCSQYLCPDTHMCVDRVAACPCPNEQDVKCIVPDALDDDGATVVCVRGANECADVNRLMRRFSK